MSLPFLDREAETARIIRAFGRGTAPVLVCVYGRRRVGKSRLVQQALRDFPSVYYVGDERDAAVQRAAVAREIGRLLPTFAAVAYPGWEELLERWRREAPPRAVLALDELPALVRSSPELPSVLQKLVDRQGAHPLRLLVCGSSQRMMHGLVLDASAPLYGRAQEILRIEPLRIGWLKRALGLRTDVDAVDRWAVWGGVPRYWELAAERRGLWKGVQALILDPLGVLHREPDRLLVDDLAEVARSASILALVGAGAQRVSEIGGRLGVPATSLSRPLALLQDLGLLRREVPFGTAPRDAKRSFYAIDDSFLDFCFRYLEPNRSRLASGNADSVLREIRAAWPVHLGTRWERLVRDAVGRAPVLGERWLPAQRWWGAGLDGRPMEIDVVAASARHEGRVLVGEAKVSLRETEVKARLEALRDRAGRCPALVGRQIVPTLWILRQRRVRPGSPVLTARDVVEAG